jgi:broad specificity phosphatase PhoE
MKPTLLLVRHGQAGQDPAHYDQLSPLGVEQSRRLASYWLAHGEYFEGVCSGSLVRQKRTLESIREGFAKAGRPLPDAEVLEGLNEYGFQALIGALAAIEPEHPALLSARADSADRRRWIPMLRAALHAWSEGRLDGQAPEAYRDFAARVARTGSELRERARAGRSILAVSSGGFIASFVQQALGAPPAASIDLNLALRNTGQAAFRLDASGSWQLLSFNALPHLSDVADRHLWTMI